MTEATKVISRVGAARLGLPRYFTGKPCKHGHVAERRVGNRECIACEADPARVEKRRAVAVQWHADNPGNAAENSRKFREESPGIARARVTAWKAENKQRVAAYSARRRAAKAMALRPFDAELHALVEEEAFALAAAREAATGVPHNVDHVVPLISEVVCGLHNEFNLAVIPARQNAVKSNRYWPDRP